MNQNFSKSKFYTNHLYWSIFNGGGGGGEILGYKFKGVKILDFSKVRFPTIIILVIFWTGGKNSSDYLEKKYGNISWYFCSSITIFLEFYWKFDNTVHYFLWVCQNISKCLKLHKLRFRSVSIVFRTWFSTAWSIARWSGYCDLNKGECNLNQSNDDSFVKLVAKNNNWNNGDRHKIDEMFLINCFVFVIILVWQTVHSSAMTHITASLMEKTLQLTVPG